MIQKKYIFVFVSILTLLSFPRAKGWSQVGGPDKFSLLTQPFNERPLNMHKGQLQANAGYRLGIRTRSYDGDGNKIGLTEDGTASVGHALLADIRYGLTGFLELGAEMNYLKQGIRGQAENYFSLNDFTTVNHFSEYKGFQDLFLWTSLRLPMEFRIVDLALRAGITLPTAKHEPDSPSNTIEQQTPDGYLIGYNNNLKNGTGVPVWNLSGEIKIRFQKFSLMAGGGYSHATKEGASHYYRSVLEDGIFIYEMIPYAYFPGNQLQINGFLHFQAVAWLDLFFGGDYYKKSGGWTQQDGKKYANFEETLTSLLPGFEIQISPLVRFRQVAGFPVSGKNMDAPFYLLTSLSFNLMPFASK